MRRSHVVALGETPASIARKYTGDPLRYPEIVAANPQKARFGDTFRVMREGDLLALPRGWRSVGLGNLPQTVPQAVLQPNGLPSTDSIVSAGVSAGINYAFQRLNIPVVADAVTALSKVAADAWNGYVEGVGTAATISLAASSPVLTAALTAVGIDVTAGSAAAGVAAFVSAAVPVAGLVVGAVIGAYAAVNYLGSLLAGGGGCEFHGVPGPGGGDVACSDYYNATQTAIQWAQANPAVAVTLSPDDFSNQASIYVQDVSPSGQPPYVPGAASILHMVQLAMASAYAASMPNLWPLMKLTLPSQFPLLQTAATTIPFTSVTVPSDIDTIDEHVAPLHDAIVTSAVSWASSQPSPPSDSDIAKKFQLVPVDVSVVQARASALRTMGGSHKQVPVLGGEVGSAPKSSVAEKVAGTTIAVGAIGAAVTWGVAAYKGVSLATVVHDWYSRVRKAL